MRERKFKKLEKKEIDGDYWKPASPGSKIEGEIVRFKEGEYGEQIILKLEDGSEIELPAHRDIQDQIENLYEKDYIRVTLTGFKKSNNPEFNDKPLYDIEVAES